MLYPKSITYQIQQLEVKRENLWKEGTHLYIIITEYKTMQKLLQQNKKNDMSSIQQISQND